jgi:hypothetical protein
MSSCYVLAAPAVIVDIGLIAGLAGPGAAYLSESQMPVLGLDALHRLRYARSNRRLPTTDGPQTFAALSTALQSVQTKNSTACGLARQANAG